MILAKSGTFDDDDDDDDEAGVYLVIPYAQEYAGLHIECRALTWWTATGRSRLGGGRLGSAIRGGQTGGRSAGCVGAHSDIGGCISHLIPGPEVVCPGGHANPIGEESGFAV
jgi:hypothetical protein